MWQQEDLPPLRCVLEHGCPCAPGACAEYGECYIWRCEHPHAPAPEPEEA